MVYEKVSQDSNEEASSEAFDDQFPKSQNGSRYGSIKEWFRKHWIHLTQTLLVLLQIVLFALFLSSKSPGTALTATVQYGRNFDYMTLDHQYDAFWLSKAIDTGGYIVINEHGGPFTDIEYGAISMFHQLHCLRSFRNALQDAQEGRFVAMDWRMDRHWPHCLWYLHQSILCSANGFIERETEWNGTSGFIDGADDFRQCGDKEALYKLFEEKDASKYNTHD